MLTTSEKGLNVIRSFEGCALRAYRDSVGVWTIGYGLTNMDKNIPWVIKEGLTITQAEADFWMPKSLADNYEPAVLVALKDPTQPQFDAGAGFHYNTGAIKRAGWPKFLNAKDMASAKVSLLSWNHAGGQILAGLTRRRNREWSMIERGDYGPEGMGRVTRITHSEDGKKDAPAPAGTPTTPFGSGMLGLHDTGPEVSEVQGWLKALGLVKSSPTGTFDEATETAVKAFQKSHPNLNTDGIVGPATRNALLRDVASRKKAATGGKVVAGTVVSAGVALKTVGAVAAKIIVCSAGVIALGVGIYLLVRYRDEIMARFNRLIGREVK
jgi:lysozyme